MAPTAAAAAAAQFLQQYMSAILANQFNGMSKFRGFIQTFEMLVEEHDEAGQVGYQLVMTPEEKRRLLIAPPARGVNGRTSNIRS